MNILNLLLQRVDSLLSSLNSTHIAVAVSGGADSMALCLLLNEWATLHQLTLTAITVDHQLRPESTSESKQVQKWLTERGIHHETLIWNHPALKNNVQERAREARYALLIEYCKHHHIEHLWLGHHQHDQWETFFMRLSHSSGLKGLASILPHTHRNGIKIYRPFLNIDPATLKEYLISQHQQWIDDPSNQLRKYERIRWRDQIDTLSQMGLSPAVVHTVCEKLSHDDQALEWSTINWISDHVIFDDQLKFIECNTDIKQLPESLMKRIALHLASQVRGINITSADVRHNMDSLIKKLTTNEFKPFTFAGCYWMEHLDKVYVVREWDKCPHELISSANMIYDHRFKLEHLAIGKTLEPVGKKYWPQIKPWVNKSPLPYQVFLSLPIIAENNQRDSNVTLHPLALPLSKH